MLKCEKSYILNIVEVFTKMGDILYIKILRLVVSFHDTGVCLFIEKIKTHYLRNDIEKTH